MRNGKTSVTDGPYAETKEQVAGFYFIEARDLNEAIQVASRFPSAPLGTVEVRPCRDLVVDGVIAQGLEGLALRFPCHRFHEH